MSKALQLPRWQRHDFWRQSLGFQVWQEKQTTQSRLTRAQIRSSQIAEITEEQCPQIWITIPPSPKTETLGHDSRNSGSSWKNSFWSPGGRIAVRKKVRKRSSEAIQGNIPTRACLYVHRQSELFLVRVCQRQHMVGERENLRPTWGSSETRRRCGGSDAIIEPNLDCTRRSRC